ncbi:hypothetical protein LPJ58_003126 [Coemansia sp. RSA 1591]|nr:hypothetical protein LPJ58_003126 [Coemansia sp. RSA 1591]KAJ1761457.1 hypothetical protein LPJ69_003073 [Coemansia sp. RSA 1752]KAJ2151493.1 hypothetical protein J3F82_003307 [Coemansia sp. RSA 637]KAJ2442130.1 hypothetical protein IWW46_003177 [Coemansia sp. RSA 2440]KAJ2839590.1 hypothetical protein J3B01_000567 [Coemansia erecta]
MLDRLPEDALQLLVQYLRSWSYKQDDLRQLSQCSHVLRVHALRRVFEYFTITDIVVSTNLDTFTYVQPSLTRLLITDDAQITDMQWDKALDVMERMDWSRITMVSVELDALHRESAECMGRVVRFVQSRLAHVREQWVGLTANTEVARLFFERRFEGVRELRVIGKPMDAEPEDPEDPVPRERGPPLELPAYGELSVIYLDGTASYMTSVLELVRRSHMSVQDLNIDEFSLPMSFELGMLGGAHAVDYPLLRRLAISNKMLEIDTGGLEPASLDDTRIVCGCGLLQGTQMPALTALYFSESRYPSLDGLNLVAERRHVRLTGDLWPNLRVLAVDGLTRADVNQLGSRMPWLEVLSIGALGNDVQLLDTQVPSVPADLWTVAMVLAQCPRLVDLRIETPEIYEDMFNNVPSFALHYAQRYPDNPDEMPMYDRPFDPALECVENMHFNLRHLTLNSWALTFDQITGMLEKLCALNSFEGILHFTPRYAVTRVLPHKHTRLSHLSLAHSTQVRYKHIFKANLCRFVSMFAVLRSLEVYSELEIPGLEKTVRALVPGCRAGFYSLIPTWLLDAIDAGEVSPADVRRHRIKR